MARAAVTDVEALKRTLRGCDPARSEIEWDVLAPPDVIPRRNAATEELRSSTFVLPVVAEGGQHDCFSFLVYFSDDEGGSEDDAPGDLEREQWGRVRCLESATETQREECLGASSRWPLIGANEVVLAWLLGFLEDEATLNFWCILLLRGAGPLMTVLQSGFDFAGCESGVAGAVVGALGTAGSAGMGSGGERTWMAVLNAVQPAAPLSWAAGVMQDPGESRAGFGQRSRDDGGGRERCRP
jgi:hypothetical protein